MSKEKTECRRSFIKKAGLVATVGYWPLRGRSQQEELSEEYSTEVLQYLGRLYGEERREYTFRASYPGGFKQWQADARPALRRLLGLPSMHRELAGHKSNVVLNEPEDCGSYTRRLGSIETEWNVRIPFWLLEPKGDGPFPLAITPHGHDTRGYDSSAGYAHDEEHRKLIQENDKDVAVQAVRRGFIAVAPATRGLGVDGVPDIHGRHGKRDCRSQLMHCLVAGRTPIGERVWDMRRIVDWAIELPRVDSRNILMMGNSGGGMVTLYASACDERITVAVPSCSFTTIAGTEGRIYHCDCNAVPGILRFGDLYDVAGLIAPRSLLVVNGRHDRLHSKTAIDFAVERLRAIYEAAGKPERFEFRWGEAGHRFYADLMWPFVLEAVA